ncbi:hypothetical protein NXS19_001191 [Fusarium pseudograminearum]|nr:hypothetical protein NXS19_001191 [Fusarium pseudograminearum]
MRFSSGDLHYIDYTARLLDQELIAGTTHLGPHRKVSLAMDYPATQLWRSKSRTTMETRRRHGSAAGS